jgi:hypothetical protein
MDPHLAIKKYLANCNYAEAAMQLDECESKENWDDAAWLAREYLVLEDVCRGTEFYDEEAYEDAKRCTELCEKNNDWFDACWVAALYVKKVYKLLKAVFKVNA